MAASDYQRLAGETSAEAFVRRALDLLAADLRQLALLALGEWQQVGIATPELLPALAALQNPTAGAWNGLLRVLLEARHKALSAAGAAERKKLAAATGLEALADFWNRTPPPPSLHALQPLARIAGAEEDAVSFANCVQGAIQLATRAAMSPDPFTWEQARRDLLGFVNYLAADPLAAIGALMSQKAGVASDAPAALAAPEFSLADPGLAPAFSALIGRPELSETSFRQLLARHAPESFPGFLLGDFLVGRPVGEGGFGTVHLARQISTGRKVAVKLLHDGMPPEIQARFQREAAFLARFNHPHIVGVLAYGKARWAAPPDAQLADEPWFAFFARSAPEKSFIALEWIEGQTLDAIYRQSQSDPAQRRDVRTLAEWFAQSARALAAVHAANLVHRDVKPSNLMVTEDGAIKLMDFGIARVQEDQRTLMTATGRIFGTVVYMSPEQIRAAETEALVGPGTDIYSLCATFYELFTLTRLYEHDRQSIDSVRTRKLTGQRPSPPRAQVRDLPWEIEVMLLGGLEAEVADRYRSMEDLERDLRHFLRDEPIEYRRPSAVRRLRLGYRRHRAVANVVAAALLLAVAGTSLYIHSLHQEQARTQAEKIRAEHLAAENFEERARQEMLNGNPLQSLVLAAEASRLGDHSTALRFLIARGMNALPPQRDPLGFSQPIYAALFDPRGERIATAGINGVSALWEARSGALLKSLPAKGADPPQEINSAVFSPDGTRLITTSDDFHLRAWDIAAGTVIWGDGPPPHAAKIYGNAQMLSPTRIITASETTARGNGTAILWDAPTGTVIARIECKGSVNSASLSPDGRYAVMATDSGCAFLEAAAGTLKAPLAAGEKLLDARIAPDDRHVVTAGDDGLVEIWDVESPTSAPLKLAGHTDRVRRVRYSPDGSTIVSAGYDGAARVWDAAGRPMTVLAHRPNAAVFSAEFSPDGASIITAASDGTACLWEARNGRKLATLRAGYRNAFSAAFSPDGKLAATAGQDGLGVWDVADPAAPRFLWGAHAAQGQVAATFAHAFGSHVTAAAYSPDGRRIATADNRGGLQVWDAATQAALDQAASGDPITAVAFDLTGTIVLAGHESGQVTLRETANARSGSFNPPHRLGVFGMAVSPDGRLLATAGLEGEARVWDLATHQLVGSLAHGAAVRSVMFSNDGRQLLTACDDGAARLWAIPAPGAVAALAPVAVLPHPGGYVNDACFSPDGTRIVTAGEGEARVWTAAGAPLQTLPGGRLAQARWSPDGTKIATSSKDGAVKIWRLAAPARYAQAASLEGHARLVKSVQFSPDGTRLATAGDDGEAFLWDAATGRMLYSFEEHMKPLELALWSPDGRRLLTAGDDGLARLWNAGLADDAPEDLAALVRQRVPWQLANGLLVSKDQP